MKLLANFLKVSAAYLTATSGDTVNGSYASTEAIAVTPIFGNGTQTNFYVVRHADFTSTANTTYRLSVSTSAGKVTIPQLGAVLALNGRDSKIHVTDYDVGGINLVYSSAEVYTWARAAGSGRVLILYGGAGETHEVAFSAELGRPAVVEGRPCHGPQEGVDVGDAVAGHSCSSGGQGRQRTSRCISSGATMRTTTGSWNWRVHHRLATSCRLRRSW